MRVVVCCAALLVACETSHEGATSRFIAAREADCVGAFTPGSDTCRGEIEEDTLPPHEVDHEQEPVDRCSRDLNRRDGTPGVLRVSFATTPLHGTYEPRNCGAVWIEDSNDRFVRTLEIWADERARTITLWYPRACHDDDLPSLDVVSTATLPTHQAHTASWDGKDLWGNLVPDGDYTLWLQVTESDFVPEGPFHRISVTRGREAWESTRAGLPGFTDIHLSYEP